MFQKRIILIFFIILSLLGGAFPAFAAKDYNIKNDTESFLFINGTTGNVGIATTVPVGKLEVNGGTAASSKIVNIGGTFADLGGTRTGLYVDVTADQVGTGASFGSWSQVRTADNAAATYTNIISGSFAESLHSGNATVDHLAGAMTVANQYGAGAVTNAYGIYPQVWKGSGTITNAYGLYFQGVPPINPDTNVGVGVVTNQYGIAINKLTMGTSRNIGLFLDDGTAGAAATGDFGIYQEFADANYFAGNIGIGTSTVPAQLTMYSAGDDLVDSRTNIDETGTKAIESRYYVGTPTGNRVTPSDINNFRFFSGAGGFQEAVSISINTPQTLMGNVIGTVDFKTQGSDGLLTPRMTINDQGALFPQNVGIGTIAPAASLQVGIDPAVPAGSLPAAAIKGNLVVDGRIYGDGSQLTGINEVSDLTDNYIPRANGSTALEDSIIYDDGVNIGIGSTSPAGKLDVDGSIYIKNMVGVGTTAPLGVLHILTESATSMYYDRYGGAPPNIIFRRANGTRALPTAMLTDNQLFAIGGRGYGATGFSAGGRAAVFAAAAENWTDAAQGAYLGFTTTPIGAAAASERLRIIDSGNVGIGTTAPVANLHVGAGLPTLGADLSSKSAFIKGNLEVDGKIYGDGSELTGITAANPTVDNVPKSNGTILIDSSIYEVGGNVGIGTTEPAAKLDIIGTGTTTATSAVVIRDAGRMPLLTVLDSGNLGLGVDSPDALLEINNNTVSSPGALPAGTTIHFVQEDAVAGRILVDTFDAIGVFSQRRANGTAASPSAVLAGDILGNVGALGYGATGYAGANRVNIAFAAEEDWTDAAYGAYMFFQTTAVGGVGMTEKMRISSTGNVAIGTTEPLARLHVGGGTIPDAMSITGSDAYIVGNLEVDGKIYGNGSGLTDVVGAVSGLTATRVPVASSSTTLADSVISVVGNNVGIGTVAPRTALDTFRGTLSGSANDYTKGQFTMAGGGIVTWAGPGGKLKWTNRFYLFPVSQTTSSSGYLDFYQPTTDIPAAQVYTGVARTADADGVVLNGWEALYAVHTPGSSAGAITYRIVRYTVNFDAPSNWVLIAACDATYSTIKLGSGVFIAAGGTWSLNNVAYVYLQSATPGTQQIGHLNLSGSGLFAGNVGIGTTAPVAALHVGGAGAVPDAMPVAGGDDAFIAGNLEVDGRIYGDGSELTGITAANPTVDNVPKSNGTSLVDSVIYSVGGNVGIGVISPQQKLEVDGKIYASGNFRFIDGNQSIFVGSSTAFPGTQQATGLGYNALANDTGRYASAVGAEAGLNNVGWYLSAFGWQAGLGNTGDEVVALGYESAQSNQGDVVVALGDMSAFENTADLSLAVGYQTGWRNSGEGLTALGHFAASNNEGLYATYLGYAAGWNATGNYTLGIGYDALRSSTAHNVVAIGYEAGENNATAGQFILKQNNVNTMPLIQGDFASGNVGIGTTVPTEKLQVVGNVGMGNAVDAQAQLNYKSASDGTSTELWIQTAVANNTTKVVLRPNGTSTTPPSLQLSDTATSVTGTTHNFIIGTGSSSVPDNMWNLASTISGNANATSFPIGFLVSNPTLGRFTALTVATSGNIGIGTIEPLARLHVGNVGSLPDAMNSTGYDVYIKGNVEFDGKIYGDGSALTGIAAANPTVDNVPKSNGTSLVDSEIYSVGGNVGIGSTAPDSLVNFVGATAGDGGTNNGSASILHVKQNTAWSGNQPWALFVEGYSYLNGFRINANDGQRALFKTAAGGQLGFATVSNDPITFTQSNSLERMRVAAGGNIGIGTTVPLARLAVVGVGTATARAFEVDDNLYNPKFIVLDNGNVGIGTTLPRAFLEVGTAADITAGSLPAAVIKGNLMVDGKIYGDGSGLTGVGGAGLTGLTATHVPVASSGTTIVDSNIYYVGGNVGIGTANPGATLAIGVGAPTGNFTNWGLYVKDDAAFDGAVNFSAPVYFNLADIQIHNYLYFSNETNDLKYASDLNTVFTKNDYRHSEFDHPSSTNPFIYINSGTNPDVSNNQWGGLTHNTTNFVLSTGVNTGAGSAPTTNENAIVLSPRGTEAMRVTGLGNVGIGTTAPAGKMEVAGQYFSRRYPATATIDWTNGNVQYLQLASGVNVITFTGAQSGGRYLLELKQPSSGAAGTVTWDANVQWPNAAAPTLTTTNSQTDITTFYYNGTNYAGAASLNYAL